mgnify:CR=1 FL=1|jgi:DNA repair protein RadC
MKKNIHTIKDIPKIDRPREKLMQYGSGKLSNSELLAILLRSGRKGENVVQLSKRILTKFNTTGLANAQYDALSECHGIGPAKACEIIACFELGKRFLKGKKARLYLSAKDVWVAMRDVRNNKKEHVVIFYLNARSQEIKKEIISVGILTNSIIHPREIFEPAIRHNAAHIIVAHNHPSDDPTPSEQDIAITYRLVEAGKILGIDLIDHVIVSPTKYFSMAEHDMIQKNTSQ